MKKVAKLATLTLIAIVAVLLTQPVVAQDLTTSLSKFLTGLRAGYMTFPPKTADPSGATEGSVYYNDTDNGLKVYNGATWVATGSTTASTFTATTGVKIGTDALLIKEFNSGFISFRDSGDTTDKGLYIPASDVYANTLQIQANGRTEYAGGGYIFFNGGTTFASLGTPTNGTMVYCSDCTFANPCAGAGTGALAKRLAGAWRCD